eukprot:GHRR01016046.1.p5 GENE.GHRR01016046.1~~GHRR01016046.1.p5  ORF type:complete len:109 (-),score=16.98 GHRR01016046.1:2705-3031(-)
MLPAAIAILQPNVIMWLVHQMGTTDRPTSTSVQPTPHNILHVPLQHMKLCNQHVHSNLPAHHIQVPSSVMEGANQQPQIITPQSTQYHSNQPAKQCAPIIPRQSVCCN